MSDPTPTPTKILFTAEQLEALKPIPLRIERGSRIEIGTFKLEPGYYVFFVDMGRIDLESFAECLDVKPEDGIRGGSIIGVDGDPEKAIKIFRIKE